MKACCTLEFHDNKPLSCICTNPKCQNNRIFCAKCLKIFHKDCLDYTLDIDDIDKRIFSYNVAWIQDPTIAKTIMTLEKFKITGSRDQLIAAMGNLIDEEFNKLMDFFVEKIKEAKMKVMENIKKSAGEDNNVLERFVKKLKTLYNFDSFLGILEPLKQDVADIDGLSKELHEYLEYINSQQKEMDELRDMAKKIGNLTKSYLELELQQFEKFKESLSFGLFDNYPSWTKEDVNSWTWSSVKKSQKITLSEDMKIAKKTVNSDGYHGILGDVEFSQGKARWEMDIATEGYVSRWVCFGIIEPQYAKNINNLPYNSYLGLSTRGQTYGLQKVNELKRYDNQKYLCELDLETGTFTISSEGVIACRETYSLKNKRFIPFVVLYMTGNMAKLTVLKNE